MTHFCSLKSTHTKNTICPFFARGQERAGPRPPVLERQPRIQKKLAARHLSEDCLVLYDVSSSYYEGHTCPLAQYGHDRDGKKGLPIIVYVVVGHFWRAKYGLMLSSGLC